MTRYTFITFSCLQFLYSMEHSKKHKVNCYKVIQGVPKIKLRYLTLSTISQQQRSFPQSISHILLNFPSKFGFASWLQISILGIGPPRVSFIYCHKLLLELYIYIRIYVNISISIIVRTALKLILGFFVIIMIYKYLESRNFSWFSE